MPLKTEHQTEPEHGAHKDALDRRASDPRKQSGQEATPLHRLQRARGNRFVQRLLKGSVLRHSAAGASEQEGAVPPIVRQTLESPGRALDSATRQRMESSFGVDFGDVRVHTDGRAAASADAIDASAYTAGKDIVFAQGQYAPGTAEGDRVLAHELTHVVQQGGEASAPQALRIGPADGPAEREADAVANAVAANQPAPASRAGGEGGEIRRSLAGGIIGGVAGAGAGGLIGGLMGGPIGAIVGGVLGAVAGVVAGDILSSPTRKLTNTEKTEAKKVYGDSLNLDEIKIVESSVMTIGGFARTLPDVVYMPLGEITPNLPDYMPLLIHELAHTWQYQHGISVKTTLFHAIFSSYDYGGEAGLIRARAQKKKFIDFNTEQQGDICRDYYLIITGHSKAPRNSGTGAWDPYIKEVQGTKPGADITSEARDGDRFTQIG